MNKTDKNETDKNETDNKLEYNGNENIDTTTETFEKWDDLNIDRQLLRSIYSYGYEFPSNIQKKAIIPLMQGKDILAQAQSGTGKTAAFTIGTLSRIDVNNKTTQALILAPTHELAHQITNVVKGLSSLMDKLCIKTIVGGTSINNDAQDMKNNPPHIIVGCPGRVCDMIHRKYINALKIKILVIDEADEMLSCGFKDQFLNILQEMDLKAQIALFSATLPNNILYITEKIMNDPIKICVKSESLTLEGIKQYFVPCITDSDKFSALKDLYSSISVSQCIIYCNSVSRVMKLYDALIYDNYPVCCIHSNMTKDERNSILNEFKKGNFRILISSNVTARGIDIQQVSVVINFDICNDIHTYLHRIGRSGRWGRKGTGITFINQRDVRKMKEIEQYYHTEIVQLPSSFIN